MSVNVFSSQASRDWARTLDDTMERWRIRHEVVSPAQEILHLSKPVLESFLRSLDRAALIDLKTELDLINRAIQSDQSQRRVNGYRNYSWFVAADKVRHICKIYSQVIQTELGFQKPKKKNYPQFFVDIAQEILPPDVYEIIKQKTIERMEELGVGKHDA